MNRTIVATMLSLVAQTTTLAQTPLSPPEIHARNASAVVFIHVKGTDANGVPQEAFGTGTMVSNTGHVLGPLHILQGSRENSTFDSYEIWGSVGSRAEFQRKMNVQRQDKDADLALFKFEGNRADYLPVDKLCLGTVKIREGDPVVAIGFPRGSDRSVVDGTVSNLSSGRFWQTNLLVTYGYSGAPVFSTQGGRVIGFVAGGTPGVDGRNFITPLNEATGLLTHLPDTPGACPLPSRAQIVLQYHQDIEKGICDPELLDEPQLQHCNLLVRNTPSGVLQARIAAVDELSLQPPGAPWGEFGLSFLNAPSMVVRVDFTASGKIGRLILVGIATGRVIDPATGREISPPIR